MFSLIVMPGAKLVRRPRSRCIVVDTKDFTMHWACRNIPGMRFGHIEIWESEDNTATAYAMTRAYYDGDEPTILLTKSVWEGLESLYKSSDVDPEFINEFRSSCEIMEDLNGSN